MKFWGQRIVIIICSEGDCAVFIEVGPTSAVPETGTDIAEVKARSILKVADREETPLLPLSLLSACCLGLLSRKFLSFSMLFGNPAGLRGVGACLQELTLDKVK